MAGAAKRMTLRLHLPAIRAMDELVAAGWAPSRNALVERLLEEALRRHRRRVCDENRYREYREAFENPDYRQEQTELLQAFSRADAEALEEAGR